MRTIENDVAAARRELADRDIVVPLQVHRDLLGTEVGSSAGGRSSRSPRHGCGVGQRPQGVPAIEGLRRGRSEGRRRPCLRYGGIGVDRPGAGTSAYSAGRTLATPAPAPHSRSNPLSGVGSRQRAGHGVGGAVVRTHVGGDRNGVLYRPFHAGNGESAGRHGVELLHTGAVSDVAVYHPAVSAAAVSAHYLAARNSQGLAPMTTMTVTDPGQVDDLPVGAAIDRVDRGGAAGPRLWERVLKGRREHRGAGYRAAPTWWWSVPVTSSASRSAVWTLGQRNVLGQDALASHCLPTGRIVETVHASIDRLGNCPGSVDCTVSWRGGIRVPASTV